MIKSIEIIGEANFSKDKLQIISNLKKINFFYGSNGTGKTTISRIINNTDTSKYVNCKVNWDSGNILEKRIYNTDFVELNFKAENLKGVFTLGEENIETKNKIKECSDIIKKCSENKNLLKIQLKGENGAGGKESELRLLDDKYKNLFWKQKTQNEDKMKTAFEGFMGSKDAFKNKVLKEKNNTAELLEKTDLEKQCNIIFADVTPAVVPKIEAMNFDNLCGYENAKIMLKKIIGKDDIDIAKMMKKLENADWVRQGKNYFKVNNKICPFCQQKVGDEFIKNLQEYFNDEFENDVLQLKNLLDNYKIESERMISNLQNLLNNNVYQKYIKFEDLQKELVLFDKIKNSNIQKIESKQKELSREFVLDGTSNIDNTIKLMIENANKAIEYNNKIAKTLNTSKNELIEKVWRYITNEIKDAIKEYEERKII
jgi:wobble nucleotide-excising tRNase